MMPDKKKKTTHKTTNQGQLSNGVVPKFKLIQINTKLRIKIEY
jgi:hypothetical protein